MKLVEGRNGKSGTSYNEAIPCLTFWKLEVGRFSHPVQFKRIERKTVDNIARSAVGLSVSGSR